MSTRDPISIKVVVIGDSGVGKTALAIRFASNTFSEVGVSTIGAAYLEASRIVGDLTIKFLISDTAGQERFQSVIPMYFRGAHAAILVYDITSQDTFFSVPRWFNQMSQASDSIRAVVACGNKIDLASQRAVSADEGSTMAANLGFAFYETSACDGRGVEEAFHDVVFTLFGHGRGSVVFDIPQEPAGVVSLEEEGAGRKKMKKKRRRMKIKRPTCV